MTPLLKAYATTLREASHEMGPGPLFGAYRTCLSAAARGFSELDPGLAYVHDPGALRFHQRRALQNLAEAQAIREAAKECAKGRADRERLVMNAMAWEHAANEFKHLRAQLDIAEARRKGQQYTVTTAGTHGVKLTFGILHEAIASGGYSASRIVERLREVGVSVTVSDLHGHGLQAVANAITDAASIERDLTYPVAQLRHLYENLVREGKREIADGLLSPQIRALEEMMMTDEDQ